MESVTQEIILREWEMFDAVEGAAGRASCQDDYETFYIMRESQLKAWNDETRESYLSDLKMAQKDGRNLLSEKYAYMMENTSPQEFEKIRGKLPVISQEKQNLIRQIVKAQLAWQEEAVRKYPALTGAGRPVYSSGDTLLETSFETYLKGELCTYSLQTLDKYVKHILDCVERGRNINLEILANMAEEYGYTCIAQAEEKIRRQEL